MQAKGTRQVTIADLRKLLAFAEKFGAKDDDAVLVGPPDIEMYELTGREEHLVSTYTFAVQIKE